MRLGVSAVGHGLPTLLAALGKPTSSGKDKSWRGEGFGLKAGLMPTLGILTVTVSLD